MIIPVSAGDLEAGIVDNSAHPSADGHRSGYNGVAWLKSVHREENLFVPLYAGLNLELYFDGWEERDGVLKEPRSADMTVSQIDDRSAELHQPPTPIWQVESWTTIRLEPPHYIDFEYRAVPHEETFKNGFMGIFWASYIHFPEDIALHIPVRSGDDVRWISHHPPSHGEQNTHLHCDDRFDVQFSPAHDRMLYGALSPWRYARPYYYGVSHGMMYLFMTGNDPRIRFTQSPNGGGAGCPAWDFQMIIPEYRAGETYGFRARVAYKPFTNHQDAENEYTVWQRTRAEF